jgi:hypothetical protein
MFLYHWWFIYIAGKVTSNDSILLAIFAGENFVSLAIITSDTDFYNLYLYFIKIYVHENWELRNVTSDIEREIEMILVNIEKREKRK